jgi:hypothetical protein
MVKFKCAQRNTKNVKALELRAFMPPGNSLGAGSSRKNYRITPWLMPQGGGQLFPELPHSSAVTLRGIYPYQFCHTETYMWYFPLNVLSEKAEASNLGQCGVTLWGQPTTTPLVPCVPWLKCRVDQVHPKVFFFGPLPGPTLIDPITKKY